MLFCPVLGKGEGRITLLEARKSVWFTLSEPRKAECLFQHPTGPWRPTQNQSVVSLKPTALSPSSGSIQPGDLGLTCGCQAFRLSAGTQGSLSLDNNSQEHRDPGQGARDKLSVTHTALDGLLG